MKQIAVMMMLIAIPCFGILNKPKWEERESLGKHFKTAKVKGTFLLYDLKKNQYIGYDLKRANTGFLPASSYKIFNSLVALETGAVRDETEVLKWDGIERGIKWNGTVRNVPSWNQDQNMRDAIKNSTVWFYQEMARRIGQEKMQKYIKQARYGNMNIGGGIDRFWLDGKLRITAKEQIEFLIKLYQNKLPFSGRSISIVKDIILNEKTDKYVLRAKTGWAFDVTPQIGWWVGYVERDGNAYFFAMNIDIVNPDNDLSARTEVTKSILREMKIID